MVDRLGDVGIAPALVRALAIPLHRVGRQRDHRNAGRALVRLEEARGLPAVDHRKRQVEENEVGLLLPRERDACGAVHGDEELELVLEELDEEIAIPLEVLDDHDALH